MGMVVRTNTMAINANRQLGVNNNQVSKSLEKLSSGFRINRAGDDASGLAISEKMKAQIKGLEQASANAQDGISLVQTAEGSLAEVHDMLNRMVELAEKSANGILEDEDRTALQDEMDALATEIDRIADSANFNNLKLFDGSLSSDKASGITIKSEPTSKAVTFTDGTTGMGAKKASASIDLAGLEVEGAGKLTFTVGGKNYDIDVEDGDDAAAIAGKLGTALNTTKVTDTTAGDFTPTVTGTTITLAAANTGAVANAAVKADIVVKAAENSAPKVTGTPKIALTDGSDSGKAKLTIDLTGVTLSKGGKATFEIAGESYVVEIADADKADAEKIAEALITKLNETKLKDSVGGEFTAQADTDKKKIILNAANNGTVADDAFKEPTISVEGGDTTQPIKGLKLQIGDSNNDYDKLIVSMDDMHMDALFDDKALKDTSKDISTGMGIKTAKTRTLDDGTLSLDISEQDNAAAALKAVKSVITKVSTQRGSLGAIQNRLEHTINNLDTSYENMTAANSRIRDTDMAKEMMNYTKMNVLVQSAQAMLAQANQQPQSILQLLQ